MSGLMNVLHGAAVERMGWTLLHSLWQGVAIALLLVVGLGLLRRRSANARYLFCCGGLLLLGAAPVVTFITLSGGQRASVALPYAENGAVAVPAVVELKGGVVQLPPSMGGGRWSGLAIVVVIWMVGVVGMSVYHMGGWMWLWRVKRRGQAIGEVWQRKLETLCERMGLRRGVRLVESALVAAPATVGWLRPVVLVPASALTGLGAAELEALLAHELAHIRRGDYLVNLAQVAIETLMFYNPAAWWISAKIREERENCCDDLATEVCGDRLLYARSLASMEELRGLGVGVALGAAGGKLVTRIRRVLGMPADQGKKSTGWAGALLAVGCVLAAVAAAQLRADQTPEAMRADLRRVDGNAPATRPVTSPILPEDLVAVKQDYLIGANDLITVSVFDLARAGVESVRTARVSETGMLSLPMLPTPVEAAGQTEIELQKTIAGKYKEAGLLPDAQVSVTVVEARQRTFSILGDVANPGVYAIRDSNFRLTDALATAGGFKGKVDQVLVVRKGAADGKDGKQTERTLAVPVKELMQGNAKCNLVMRPFDRILVPGENAGVELKGNAGTVSVSGPLLRPGNYPLGQGGFTLKQLIQAAGGVDAATKETLYVELVRREGDIELTSWPIPLTSLLSGKIQDVDLKAKDAVNITDKPGKRPAGR